MPRESKLQVTIMPPSLKQDSDRGSLVKDVHVLDKQRRRELGEAVSLLTSLYLHDDLAGVVVQAG